MHIGFLTSEYPNISSSPAAGIGTSIKNMVAAFSAKGIMVSIFIYGQSIDKIYSDGGVKYHLIKQRNFKFLGWYLHRKFLQSYLSNFIVNDNIDAIEAPDWTGITAFMNFKVPLVIRCNGSDAYFCELEGRKQKWKNRWFEKNALNNADFIISASSFTGKKTKEIFNLNKNIQTIHNGVNVNDFKPLHLEQKTQSILYFGTIIRKKGVLELAASFNILKALAPNAVLTLLGKDSLDVKEKRSTLQMVMDLIEKKYWEDVVHLSEVPYDKVSKEIAKAQVIVLPSFAEAFPMTWLEAMAMEKAMVTSNIGWANEMMINGETGYMVDPNDHNDFANKIQLLLNNPNLRKRMGEKAREQVEQLFSSEVLIKRNIEFYKSMID